MAGEIDGAVADDAVRMTQRDDGTWECSAGCPFVFMRDEFQDDVAHHIDWHAHAA